MPNAFINSLAVDRRLFRAEVRASLAHADALFRAGILTKFETERVKNGLWTILKRADFDRQFFEALPSPDVYAFVEARLRQLIGDATEKFKIGRNAEHRAALVLRMWLRDEIAETIELLERLEEILQSSQAPIFQVFFEMFDRDREICGEILRRVNRLPQAEFGAEADESWSEIDFVEIARDLNFVSVAHNAREFAADRDFCLEFVNAAAFAMLHLARLASEVLPGFPSLPEDARRAFETMRGKSGKMFGHQTALLSLLKTAPLGDAGDLQEINPIVFETADTLKACLQMTADVLENLDSSIVQTR